MQKLGILGEAARYDVSCSSSGSVRGRHSSLSKGTSFGSAAPAGICHSWADDGRCISLLKVLMTNHCEYNCAYCVNRRDNDNTKAAFTPEELAALTMEFYKRNYIEGLFLSSGVVRNPDYTMGLMIEALTLLRKVYCFNGYIHVKTIPGASPEAVYAIGFLADRVSANIEFCSPASLKMLAPDKTHESIISPMAIIRDRRAEYSDYGLHSVHAPHFVPGGQSTQLIIGATNEKDYSILRLSEHLYKDFALKRVYYSAYIPVNNHPNLPALTFAPPLLREHRLYQADFLMRFYKFGATELLDKDNPDLDVEVDPKCDWALRNYSVFPVEVNRADYDMLLRVPGIGVLSARRIIAARRMGRLGYEDLKKIGVVLKRAVYFILCDGKFNAPYDLSPGVLRSIMSDRQGRMMVSPLQMRLEDLSVLRV
ncbi:MAG: putative DNA modification/repair radical SAM protein [Saccharofermentanales bacterium]